MLFFFFKQKTAYEMRISDWSSDVCSSDLGGFTLTNQDGERVADTDFAGRYRLVYFGFTYCPDVCPVDLQIIGQALRQLEQNHPEVAARVQPSFISVDPERDTPPVLKEYVAAFHPRLVGLTGTPEEIADAPKRYGDDYIKEIGRASRRERG